MSAYPDGVRARNAWVLARRGPKSALDPFTPYAVLREEEIGADGRLVPTAVILITNRECPLKCVFCDLWRNTLDDPVPPGAIAAQIRAALSEVPDAVQVKLYNAGSFFDPNAIPPDDYDDIVRELGRVERVIVEWHPGFMGGRAGRFRESADGGR
ncbi:MAG TPA: radical SAM protein, partial [Blastocatellia bacterium]|nr:radical SAM protein [Blastocatellia bacterium]